MKYESQLIFRLKQAFNSFCFKKFRKKDYFYELKIKIFIVILIVLIGWSCFQWNQRWAIDRHNNWNEGQENEFFQEVEKSINEILFHTDPSFTFRIFLLGGILGQAKLFVRGKCDGRVG